MFNKNLLISIMFIFFVSAGSAMAAGDVSRGEELAADCADCQ